MLNLQNQIKFSICQKFLKINQQKNIYADILPILNLSLIWSQTFCLIGQLKLFNYLETNW